jgi:uncharacterized protein YbcI
MSEKEKYQNATDKERFDMVKKYYGYTDKILEEITGNKRKNINTVINRETVPRWILLVNHNFAVERGYVNEE